MSLKGLKYETVWVEFPDIEAVCKKIGAPPTGKKADGSDYYTLPVIYDPSTKALVADSAPIAKYLDATYPDTPRLFPEGTDAFQSLFSSLLVPSVMVPILHILLSRINALLNPPSQTYFRSTREALFGKKLEEVGDESNWETLEGGLAKIKASLDANGEGKSLLLMGDKITYSDVFLVSLLIWVRVIAGEQSDDWKRVSALHDGIWGKYVAQFSQYE